MDVKKAIACSPLLPPPGGEVVKELGEMYFTLEKRCKELEQEKQSFIEHHEAQMEDWEQERDELLQKVQQQEAK